MSSLYASKLKLPVVFQKRHWNFAFAFEHLWLDLELLNPHFPLKLYPATLERQLNYLKCFVTVPLWQSNNLGIILCHQSFLLHCLYLTCQKLLPFLKSIWFFSYDFKNIKHLITLVNSFAVSRETLIIFIALMVSPSTNWRAWPWQYVKWTRSRLCTLLLQSWHQPCWAPHQGLIKIFYASNRQALHPFLKIMQSLFWCKTLTERIE